MYRNDALEAYNRLRAESGVDQLGANMDPSEFQAANGPRLRTAMDMMSSSFFQDSYAAAPRGESQSYPHGGAYCYGGYPSSSDGGYSFGGTSHQSNEYQEEGVSVFSVIGNLLFGSPERDIECGYSHQAPYSGGYYPQPSAFPPSFDSFPPHLRVGPAAPAPAAPAPAAPASEAPAPAAPAPAAPAPAAPAPAAPAPAAPTPAASASAAPAPAAPAPAAPASAAPVPSLEKGLGLKPKKKSGGFGKVVSKIKGSVLMMLKKKA